MPSNTEAELKTRRFKALALAHIDSIYRFSLYMAEKKSAAQAIVQDTYLKAYRSFDGFEEGTNYKTRLLTIVNAICCDRRHRERGHPDRSVRFRAARESSDNADLEGEIFREPFNDDVAAAMSKLPVEYKAVVLLADAERLSYKEIADIVGCPIGTVMSRLRRGRKLLRKGLRGYITQHPQRMGEIRDERA